jgi:(4S)-4-hydroxy-5-phosphonooxypentane-2,3-dione isomerase
LFFDTDGLTLLKIADPMIVTCVYVHVKTEAAEKFIEATTANHLESIREPGNMRFDFSRQTDDPDRFLIYEVYASEEANTAHKNTPHYLKWRDTVQEMMAEPRKGIRYHLLRPAKA